MRALRRAEDRGFLCTVAMRAGQFWDFVDKRQLDAYAISVAILYGTVRVTEWGMLFAEKYPDKALTIAAVVAPYMALQAAAIKFLFDARSSSFESRKVGMETSSQTLTTRTEVK